MSRQIAALLARVTEAIARSARENSSLRQKELLEAAQLGITTAFEYDELTVVKEEETSKLLEGQILLILRGGNHDFPAMELGRVFNALNAQIKALPVLFEKIPLPVPTVSFNEAIVSMERAGLVIINRPHNGEPLVRLSEPGMAAVTKLP
jgi:hypothetical protein